MGILKIYFPGISTKTWPKRERNILNNCALGRHQCKLQEYKKNPY